MRVTVRLSPGIMQVHLRFRVCFFQNSATLNGERMRLIPVRENLGKLRSVDLGEQIFKKDEGGDTGRADGFEPPSGISLLPPATQMETQFSNPNRLRHSIQPRILIWKTTPNTPHLSFRVRPQALPSAFTRDKPTPPLLRIFSIAIVTPILNKLKPAMKSHYKSSLSLLLSNKGQLRESGPDLQLPARCRSRRSGALRRTQPRPRW